VDFLGITIAGAIASLIVAAIQYSEARRRGRPETLEDRITKLSSALQDSSRLVAEVEGEISKRQALVVELQHDADRYQKLVSINQEQVQAVAQLLQGELRREGTRSFWKGVLANFVFFVLGALLSWYLGRGA
jgi:TolA-binding protein